MPYCRLHPFHCTKCDWDGNLMRGDLIDTDSRLECPVCKSPVRYGERLRPRNTTENGIVSDVIFVITLIAKLIKAYLFNVLSHVLCGVFLVVTVLPSFVITYMYPGLLDNGYIALSLFVVQALFSSVSCVYVMRAYTE